MTKLPKQTHGNRKASFKDGVSLRVLARLKVNNEGLRIRTPALNPSRQDGATMTSIPHPGWTESGRGLVLDAKAPPRIEWSEVNDPTQWGPTK